MKMRTICQDCNKVIKETECHHELWHWDSVGLCQECFEKEMKELDKKKNIEWDSSVPIKIEVGENVTFKFTKPKEHITLDKYKFIVPTKKKRSKR